MNEHTENDPRAELAALRERLDKLEAEHRELQRQALRARRPAFSRKLWLSALSASLLLAAVGALWGDEAMSLFIDSKGKVGIGTTHPATRLFVQDDDNGFFKTLALVNTNPGNNAQAGIEMTQGSNSGFLFQQGNGYWLWNTANGPMNFFTNKTLRMIIAGDGNVGIGTQSSPSAKLQVSGTSSLSNGTGDSAFPSTDGNSYVSGTNVILRSNGNTEQMRLTSGGNVGIGTNDPKAKLDVAGDARIQGKVSSKGRYQRDDNAESTYDIPPPYHLSLTAAYAGRTKTIPQDVLVGLCGGPSGCEVSLAMTRWLSGSETAGASRSVHFYYSASDGVWRASNDAVGVDGDGATKHVFDVWNVCYFTDGIYSNWVDQGDKEKGMQLLVWDARGTDHSNYNNPNRTCELTLASAGAP
jgi:hypothetical protein